MIPGKTISKFTFILQGWFFISALRVLQEIEVRPFTDEDGGVGLERVPGNYRLQYRRVFSRAWRDVPVSYQEVHQRHFDPDEAVQALN